MLLTITTTHQPATDLGYLLHKNPGQLQTFELPFGKAHIFYPEASTERCSVCLMLDVDPIALVRKDSKSSAYPLEQYVNDRPYASSSFLSVAIARILGSALGGRSKERPELALTPIPLEASLTAVPCRTGEKFLRNLFEPLGYAVELKEHILDAKFPEWGLSRYFDIKLSGMCTLQDLLAHIYVLIPVMDNNKHYYIGEDEVTKLLKQGEGWLAQHPEKKAIANRYLGHKKSLAQFALAQLIDESIDELEEQEEKAPAREQAIEKPLNLNEQRIATVLSEVQRLQPHRVVDLGCGEGRLVKAMFEAREIRFVLGMDVSHRALEMAEKRLHFDRLNERLKSRLQLIQGSLIYKDDRLSGFDVATCIEVIEHLDQPRLTAFEKVVFEFAKPRAVIITTPNYEYNANFETLPSGQFRHSDHRFEWTRAQFQQWARSLAESYKYSVKFLPVGPEDLNLGAPTQMGIFEI